MITGVVMPWSRIMIIIFAAAVLVGMWLLLTKTRLGLFVRGVTQNRAIGLLRRRCRPRAWTPGRSASVRASRGLAGAALSQIGNVGPDLGQSYIVDSFMSSCWAGVRATRRHRGTRRLAWAFANKLLEA